MKQVKAPEKKQKQCFADIIRDNNKVKEQKKKQVVLEEEFFPDLGAEKPKVEVKSVPIVEEYRIIKN
jgi:PP-loop superfamily ATP-utilizing enzyme